MEVLNGASGNRKAICIAALVFMMTFCGISVFLGSAYGSGNDASQGVLSGDFDAEWQAFLDRHNNARRYDVAPPPAALWESAQIAETELRYREALELYEQVLEAREKELGAEHRDTIEALNAAARVHLTLGNYNEALKRYETALAVREKAGIELDVAGSLLDMAECYWRLKDPEKAKGFAERSLEIRERKLGRHPDTAASLHRLGSIYQDLGDIDKAMELYDQALAMKKEKLGVSHQETAHTLINIATIYYNDLKDYAKAKEFNEEALMVYEKSVGKEHPDTARALRNLGNTYQSLENYNMAKEYHERALAIYLKLYGEEHADTAWSLNNLGVDYSGLKDYAKAKECDERALAIYLKLHGEEHADTAWSLNNLGVDYINLGDYAKAKEYHERALAIRLKLYGEEHADTALSLHNLGYDYRGLKDHAKAKECDERALAIRLKLHGEEHADTASSLNGLGIDYTGLGDHAKALECDERALAIRLKLYGEEHADTASSLRDLGVDYSGLEDYAKAKECDERALAIRLKLYGEEHADTAGSLNNLGYDYRGLKDYTKAKQCDERALAIRLKLYGEDHADTLDSLYSLLIINNSLMNYKEAARLGERLLAVERKNSGEKSLRTARVLMEIWETYQGTGDYAGALKALKEAYDIHTGLPELEENYVFFTLNRLVVLYSHLGAAETGLKETKPLRERLVATLENRGRNITLRELHHLAHLYDDLGEPEKAIECFEKELAVYEKTSMSWQSPAHCAAAVYFELENYVKAKEYRRQVLDNFERAYGWENPVTAHAAYMLAATCESLKEYEQAKELYERALTVFMKTDDKHFVRISLATLSVICKRMGLNNAGIFYGKMAIDLTQEARVNLSSLDEDVQHSYLRDKEYLYQEVADLLTEQGRIAEAQQVLAMMKEEEYFDFIRRDQENDPRNSVVSYTGIEKKMADQFREISARLFALAQEKEELRKKKPTDDTEWESSADAKRLAEIDGDLTIANKVFQSFLVALDEEMKTVSDANRKKEIDKMNLDALQGLKKTLKDMKHGAALIHTVITEERLWLILTTSELQLAYESRIPQAELYKKILSFRESLKDPRTDPLPMAREFYDLLVGPMAKDLEKSGAQTLMFSLDGQLRYIPMSALHDGERWLAEKYAIALYTEAAKDKLKDKRDDVAWKAAAMGVTRAHPGFNRLPAVRDELESIVRTADNGAENLAGLPGTIRLDEKFTESAFAEALEEGVPVVHVASHFRFEPGTVTDSFLLLGDGKHLTLESINVGVFAFENVEQLTFSACDTAMGTEEGAGREVEGLGVVAQKRGTKSVMATLWSVADASTGIFMSRYYSLLQQDGMTKAEALRLAQTEFIKSTAKPVVAGKNEKSGTVKGAGDEPLVSFPGYSHPYFWAPFILMGNWL